jgi:hypothetical protein
LRVELDAFSGRPNPSWQLGPTEATEFLARLRALPSVSGRLPSNDGLGYRGFVVTADGASLDGYDEVRLFRGVATARRGDGEDLFADPDRALESWLLDTAPAQLGPEVRRYIRSEIVR